MPLSSGQKKTLQVNLELGIFFFFLLSYLTPDSTIFENVYYLVFLTALVLVFAGGIVPFVYERDPREFYSVLSVLAVFYVHAIILVVFDVVILLIPLATFFSWGYLISTLLSSPVVTGVWLGIYVTLKSFRLKELASETTPDDQPIEPFDSEQTD